MYLIGIVEVVEKGGETDETNTTASYDGGRYGGNDGDVRPVSERAVSMSGHRTLKWPCYPRHTRGSSLGRVCLDEEDQRFFCPDGFELWLLRDAGSSPPHKAECVEQASPNDGGETGGSDGGGGTEVTQNSDQQGEAGDYTITTNVSQTEG